MINTVVAHSSDKLRGVQTPQLYCEHVRNVYNESRLHITNALKYTKLSSVQVNFFVDVVSLAALYHDLGKLDKSVQTILHEDYSDTNDGKLLNHVDAGVAILTNKYESTKNLAYLIAAFLVHAHHIGLKNQNPMAQECIDKSNPRRIGYYYQINKKLMRDNRDILETYNITFPGKTVSNYIDSHIKEYESIHNREVDINYIPITNEQRRIPVSALQIRIMFSSLVDADHSDTDKFYSQRYDIHTFSELNADKRMESLQTVIGGLSTKTTNVSTKRLESRRTLHKICRDSDIPNDISFFALDGSVGLGKTLSGLTYVLRLAKQRNAKRLYNIIPFTNIISQTVDEYRKSILLPGEDENNINEIHSKCEFDKIWMRKYSNRWNAPINVSTAVQFFESLCHNKPSRCRKLHWFANSIFFFDEFDKSMPHQYWQYMLPMLKDMAENFNCSFVFSSGTSAYYWDIFDETDINVHDIIKPDIYQSFKKLEQKRVKIKIIKRAIKDINKFTQTIFEKLISVRSGLIVCNTINNACVLSDLVRNDNHGYIVYELTGWQTPNHREKILASIKRDLTDKTKKVLVIATSTIECGVDISFDAGWREKAGTLNLFQFVGRINRGSVSKNAISHVFHFGKELIGRDKLMTANPQNVHGIQVFNQTKVENLTPDYCTDMVKQELSMKPNNDGTKFLRMEENRQFQSIVDEFSIIDSASATVIIDKNLIERIKKNESVAYNEIVRNSVQLWFTKIEKIQNLINLNLITNLDGKDYYCWEDDYDEISGIGKTMMSLK